MRTEARLTRVGKSKGESVGNSRKAEVEQSAASHFYVTIPRPRTAAEECEDGDDAEMLALEKMAEPMIARGVERRTALQCAAAIFDLQKAKDAQCAASVSTVFVGGVDGDGLVAAWMIQPDAADKLEQALSRAREARDSKLALGCLAFARGKPPFGCYTMRALARAHDVSVEAVSNEVSEFQDILGLPRTNQQKSAKAVKAYATNGAHVRVTMEAK